MKFLLVLAAIAVIVFVLFMKKSKEGSKHITDKHPRKRVVQAAASKGKGDFRASRIVPGDNACHAAEDLQDELFLDGEHNTPKLPLEECTNISACDCKYDHHGDRRGDEDDRRLHTLQTELYPVAEGTEKRRQKRGRRATD